MSTPLYLDTSSLLGRPEFEKLELPDLQTYLNGLTEEQRAALRESTPCPSYHHLLTDTAAPEDESYEDKLTIARLESELAEIIQ
jgi:hypothetical protein